MATVPKIAMKATGRILFAPLTPALAGAGPNAEAVAAATIPRGASQAMNIRSRRSSSDPHVPRAITSGRMINIITAIRPSPAGSSGPTDDGVTEAEINTNRIPISSSTTVP
jgi:hypothetical protein